MRDLQSQALGSLAPRRVPEAYVRAEVAAFPLTSETAFRGTLTGLEPSLHGDGRDSQSTQSLWRVCERTLSEHASGLSLDRLVAIRDLFWFARPRAGAAPRPSRGPVPMHLYLQHLAEAHLERRPGVTEVVQAEDVDTNALDAVTHYRWLTFALPEDLLLAALGVRPAPTRVDIEPPLLVRRLLDHGVNEIHHHVSAGMDFPILWASLLAALAQPELGPAGLPGPDLPLGKGEVLQRWLLAGAATRCLLAEFLLSQGEDLLDFAANHCGALRPRQRRVLQRALKAVVTGSDEELPDFFELRGLYRDLHPAGFSLAAGGLPENCDQVWKRCDPIAVRLSLAAPNAGEQWLVQHGLSWIGEREGRGGQGPAEGAPEFTRAFWQLLRLRCLFYRSVVQRPLTAGLLWFVRFQGRLGAYQRPLRDARVDISYQVAGGGRRIAALEVRTKPDSSPFELAGELRRQVSAWDCVLKRECRSAGLRDPEFGVLLHFAKERDQSGSWTSGTPAALGAETHGEPHPRGAVRLGGRYADYLAEQSTKAQATVDLLQAVPSVLWLLRGLDVASDELGIPTWVLVPLYRYTHWWSAAVAARYPAENLPALRLTAHVGEDYRHLMEGLRRIYECVQYVLRRTGSRLGHATALGVEPRLWAESVGSVVMPAEERLWDLVFEWRLYCHFRMPVELRADIPSARMHRIESNIRDLAAPIFGRPYEPSQLAEAHHLLHQLWRPPAAPDEITGLGLDAFNRALQRLDLSQVRSSRAVWQILDRYYNNEAVFRRGQQLVDITLEESEIAALQVVQNALRACVGARGMVVEVNPSSNLLIGNLLDLRNHPILRLFPPEPQEGAPPPVPIAIGADDPITFSTHLLREYSLLYEAAKGAGYPERVVHDWLVTIQRTSMDARFTEPWRPSSQEKARQLQRDLDDYLQRPRPWAARRPQPSSSSRTA